MFDFLISGLLKRYLVGSYGLRIVFLSNEMKEKYMDLLIGKFVNVQIVGNWKLVLMNTFTKANIKKKP